MSAGDGPGRRRAGLVIAAFGAALLIVYVALWVRLPGSFRTGNDFAPTYVAGHLVLSGQGSAIYDEARIVAMERAAAPAGYQVDLPYISPPAAALLAAPLSRLSFPVAESVWSLAQLLATVAAAALVCLLVHWPKATPGVFRVATVAAAAGAPAVGALLLFGESDGLFTLAVAAAYLLLVRGRDHAAAVAFGLAAGLGKPHLLIGVLLFLLFRHAWAAVIGSVATAAAANLAAVAVLGAGTAPGFLTAVLHSGIDHAPSGLVGAAGLMASWFGNGTVVRVLGLVLASGLFAACAWLGAVSRRSPLVTGELLAAAVAVGLLASPHLLVPDVVLLVPAFAWLYPRVLAGAPARRVARLETMLWLAWTGLGVATVLDAANQSVGFPGRLTPWGLLLFAATAWRVATRDSGHGEPAGAHAPAIEGAA